MKNLVLFAVSLLLSVASMYAQQSVLNEATQLARGLRVVNNRIVFDKKSQ